MDARKGLSSPRYKTRSVTKRIQGLLGSALPPTIHTPPNQTVLAKSPTIDLELVLQELGANLSAAIQEPELTADYDDFATPSRSASQVEEPLFLYQVSEAKIMDFTGGASYPRTDCGQGDPDFIAPPRDFHNANHRGQNRRRAVQASGTQVLKPVFKQLDMSAMPTISSTSWSGKRMPKDVGEVIIGLWEEGNLHSTLKAFRRIPFSSDVFSEPPLLIHDVADRPWLYCSAVSPHFFEPWVEAPEPQGRSSKKRKRKQEKNLAKKSHKMGKGQASTSDVANSASVASASASPQIPRNPTPSLISAAALCDAGHLNGQSFMHKFLETATRFVNSCTTSHLNPDIGEPGARNLRGDHFYQVSGFDRQNKKEPAFTLFHRANMEVLKEFFAPGSPMTRVSDQANSLFKENFPGLFLRFMACAQYMSLVYGIVPLYGVFWNFCLNMARSDRPEQQGRVHCRPHVDRANIAVGACILWIYGFFNHWETCWLVIWEAGLVIQLPPGVFLIYPSSLFYHFNVDINDIEFVVTRDGEYPTRSNSEPVRGWSNQYQRGSCVWFSQATMFQSAELDTTTMEKAKKAGKDTNCDLEELRRQGMFF